MSNTKSEALAQSVLKKGLLITGKQLFAGVTFIIKMQTECIKLNVSVHIIPTQKFSSKIWDCKVLFINF